MGVCLHYLVKLYYYYCMYVCIYICHVSHYYPVHMYYTIHTYVRMCVTTYVHIRIYTTYVQYVYAVLYIL